LARISWNDRPPFILEEAFKLEDALRKPLERTMREERVSMVEAVTRLVERSAKRK